MVISVKTLKKEKNKVKKKVDKNSKKINTSKSINVFLKNSENKILKGIKKNYYIIHMAIPFMAMDIATRAFGSKINFFHLWSFVPNLFTLLWITLFLGIALSLKKKIGKWFYFVFSAIAFALFIVNNVYYSMTSNFFDFNLVEMAGEGSSYFMDAITGCNPLVYITAVFILILIWFGYSQMPDKKKNNFKHLGIVFVIFLISHIITPLFLGKANSELTWNTWKNPRNIYISYNDSNKSMRISGLYEYSVRNFYVTFLREKKTNNEEDLEFLASVYSAENNQITHSNEYTGIFKGKNVIFLQLEGIDKFLLTEEIMPNLYSLKNNAYNFENHYSYYNGGGSTFNSEFAVNTGFFTPLSYTQNAYTFNKNLFPYTMAKLFKNLNYSVNAFHMNTSEFYSRGVNYENWGYDKYYGLKDLGTYTDSSYNLDTELIKNETFYNKMFKNTDNPNFVDYIITYSAHMPFSSVKGVCSQILNKQNTDLLGNNVNTNSIVNNTTNNVIGNNVVNNGESTLSELECLKIQAKETDDMIGLLIQALKDNNLYDNTVIVGYTDHYLYTLNDQTILDDYKETDNNLINNTPFFIWSSNTSSQTINKVTSQLNILPTVLNLFGVNYNPNFYIGEDALDSGYSGYVFFSDYSWYNGNVYVDGGSVTNNGYISDMNLEDRNYYINYLIRKNDLTLKYNYFKNIK